MYKISPHLHFCSNTDTHIKKIITIIVINRIDEEIAYMIQERILNYQSETGVEIEQITQIRTLKRSSQ